MRESVRRSAFFRTFSPRASPVPDPTRSTGRDLDFGEPTRARGFGDGADPRVAATRGLPRSADPFPRVGRLRATRLDPYDPK